MFKPLAECLKNDILREHKPWHLQTQNAGGYMHPQKLSL